MSGIQYSAHFLIFVLRQTGPACASTSASAHEATAGFWNVFQHVSHVTSFDCIHTWQKMRILKKPLFFDIRVDWKQFSACSYHTNLIVVFHCLDPVAGRHLLLPSLLGVGGEGVHRSLSDKYTLEPGFYWKKNEPRPWSSTKGISVNYSCWTSINTHFCRYHTPFLLTVKPNQAAAHKLMCAFPIATLSHRLFVSLWRVLFAERFHSNRNYALKNHRSERRRFLHTIISAPSSLSLRAFYEITAELCARLSEVPNASIRTPDAGENHCRRLCALAVDSI